MKKQQNKIILALSLTLSLIMTFIAVDYVSTLDNRKEQIQIKKENKEKSKKIISDLLNEVRKINVKKD